MGRRCARHACLCDEIKPGAAEAVKRLKARGIRVKLVSGDAWSTTAVVANQIGIDDYVAEAAPSAKCAIVAALQKRGARHIHRRRRQRCPALAQADLGIALGTGADIATGAARMVLMSGSLLKLEDAFQLAAKTTRIVRQNLIWPSSTTLQESRWRFLVCLHQYMPRQRCCSRVLRSY